MVPCSMIWYCSRNRLVEGGPRLGIQGPSCDCCKRGCLGAQRKLQEVTQHTQVSLHRGNWLAHLHGVSHWATLVGRVRSAEASPGLPAQFQAPRAACSRLGWMPALKEGAVWRARMGRSNLLCCRLLLCGWLDAQGQCMGNTKCVQRRQICCNICACWVLLSHSCPHPHPFAPLLLPLFPSPPGCELYPLQAS